MRPDTFTYLTDSAVRAMMIGALESGDNGWVNDLALPIDSNDASEDLAWLGTPPALQEFVGGRTEKELAEYHFSVSQKDYEGTLRVPKKTWVRDKSGQLQVRIAQFADRVNGHPAKLISSLIEDGEDHTCYDGSYFFHTAHSSKNSGTQDNDLGATASTATAPTAAEMTTAITAAIQAMYGFKDDEGEPTNQMAKRFGIMVPVPFMGAAWQAVTAAIGASGATAMLPNLQTKGLLSLEVLVNPRLTWTTKFATFRMDGATKPFVLVQDDAMRDVITLGPTSEYCQLNGKCVVGVDWSGNVAYGAWDQAVLTTFS